MVPRGTRKGFQQRRRKADARGAVFSVHGPETCGRVPGALSEPRCCPSPRPGCIAVQASGGIVHNTSAIDPCVLHLTCKSVKPSGRPWCSPG